MPRCCLLLLLFALAHSCPAAEPTPDELRARAAKLIDQLGSDKYIERRAAQRELADIGLAAFDMLYAARAHRDPEIATTAKRLLAEMTVRWARPGDSPGVRELLEDFGRSDENERLDKITELGRLSEQQGLPAVCRIARYDVSSRVAQRAAVVAMGASPFGFSLGGPYKPSAKLLDALDGVLQEQTALYGPSKRETSRWLRTFVDGQKKPAVAANEWRKEIRRLREANRRNDSAVEGVVINQLGWNLLRATLMADRPEEAAQAVRGLVVDTPDDASGTVARSIEWMDQAGAEQAFERLLTLSPSIEFLETKHGLYLIAGVRAKRGQDDRAAKTANRAFDAPPGATDTLGRRGQELHGRIAAGLRLWQKGHDDWARRELRAQIKESGVVSAEGAFAAWTLGDLLQDSAEYQAAADVLGELLTEIKASDKNVRNYEQLLDSYDSFLWGEDLLESHRFYYQALAERDAGNVQATRDNLLKAVALEPDNADILIAMYHASKPGEEYRRDVMKRIKQLAYDFEKEMDKNRSNPIPYNQWAWLIANTEGDFDKAVRFSKRSLENSVIESAGYLDTLGRCYYAAGDLDRAVEVQRRAVAQQPYYKVMQRQLKLFEDELKKRNAAE